MMDLKFDSFQNLLTSMIFLITLFLIAKTVFPLSARINMIFSFDIAHLISVAIYITFSL